MSVSASIHILHLPTNIHYFTVEESCESKDGAIEYFSKLADRIAAMERDNETFVLDTTDSGYVMLNKKFLTDSVLRLSVFERE